VAEQAFRIRDAIKQKAETGGQRTVDSDQKSVSTCKSQLHSHSTTSTPCEVIVDIMDAWPETFYQALPKPFRKALGPILLAPLHGMARRAYHGADKISAVGQSYLNLAAHYLKQRTGNRGQKTDQSRSCVLQSQHLGAEATRETTAKARRYDHQAHQQSSTHHSSVSTSHSSTAKPMMLCYHGTDLSRFPPPPQSVITHSPSLNTPLRAVYLGAMGTGYDLQTLIDVAARWKAEGQFPWQIHFAGTGSQANQLMANGKSLIADKRIIFHGHIGREAITKLLLSAHLALVPNRPGSLVACPYKVGEYAGAGLPMLSCLGGELKQLLAQWDAGSEYKEGDATSLQSAFKSYSTDPEVLKQQSLKARKMAEALFDRETSYQELAGFILS
jgi:glycosyltransferase involved in cell wall biosynthesis